MDTQRKQYHAQNKLTTVFPHHLSLADLWIHKWKAPAEASIYPFMYSNAEDFRDIFESDAAKALKEPYELDTYTRLFLPRAESLERQAEESETAGNAKKASELYLRASSVYRVARFPTLRSTLQWKAWEKNKITYCKALRLRENPFSFREVQIPHKHSVSGEGPFIQADEYVPKSLEQGASAPCVIVMGGLDAYRTEVLELATNLTGKGLIVLALEIPGTGDSPALRSDLKSPERQWSSVLDWCDVQAMIDSQRILVWGLSTGGYYAVRLAHTHHDRIRGAVGHGGGLHHVFDYEWLVASDHMEYPWDYSGALADKFGYEDAEKFRKEAYKYSLLNDGILENLPCTRLLLVNGLEDTVVPVDDCYLAVQYGDPKEARIFQGEEHMGGPKSYGVVQRWLCRLALE